MSRVIFRRATLGLCVAALASGYANAQQQDVPDHVSMAVRVGVTHSDNVERVPTNGATDTSGDVGLQADIARTQGRLNVGLASDLRYQKYFQNTYGDDLVGAVNGNASYWFLPERFRWTVQENFGQTFIDPVAVETPNNRQHINLFSTGPDLNLPIGDRTQITMMARWSDASYEVSDGDDTRILENLGLVRQLGTHASTSLNVQHEQVDFRNSTLNDGYERASAYVGFNATGARTRLAVRGGVTQLKQSGDTKDSPLVDLTVSRTMGARSVLTFNAGTNLTDSAEVLRRDQQIGGIEITNDDIVASRDTFVSDYARLGWTLSGVRSTIAFTADWRQEDHEVTDLLNRSSVAGTALFTRRISPSFTFDVGGQWRREEFDQSNIAFDEWSAGVGLDFAIARSIALNVRGDHYKGTGDTFAGGGTRNYTENRYAVSLTWTPR